MIVDTSALIAILYAEDDAQTFAQAIAVAEYRLLSAATYVEAGIVIDRQRGAAAGRQLDALIDKAGIVVEPVTRRHADLARQAYLEFGKGQHPAALNFGDCFSYALAKSLAMPLLYKGDDFRRTDVEAALPG